MSVALFDYVTPSHQGSTWGLGGTCVNVGCIPKKLCHISAQVKETTHMLKDYGWLMDQDPKYEHDWNTLRDNIQNHIKAINFGYKSKMKEEGIDYVNSYASFEDQNTIKFTYGKDNEEFKLKAKNFVIAAGNRPRDYPGIPELAEHAVTSDDIFSLKEDPGKTLVIGGGYIALERAGFLNGLGKDVTMINRSTFLRVMDGDMAFRIVDDMEARGVKALTNTVPKSVKKLGDRHFEVELKSNDKISKIEVNTILVAIGRDCSPEKLGLKNAGVEIGRSWKVQGRETEKERSNVDHIYAIGDCLEDVPELMTVALKSGRNLAHRIHSRLQEKEDPDRIKKYQTNYDLIPTTVFTPSEYSFVGLNEEEAVKKYGEENIEVYLRQVTPLQQSLVKGSLESAFMKVICLKTDDERVIGIHYMGHAADEVIQGFALSMKLGLKKEHLDSSFGVHPSVGEEFYTLDVTKRSGEDYAKTEC